MNVLPDASRITRRRKNLRKLTNARSIAFIGGASAASGIEYCRALGFQGDVWAVNPKHSELGGVPCFPRVSDLPGVPDASWIAVSTERSVDAIAELNAIGAPSAVMYTAGFTETGDDTMERRLVEVAGDIAVVGPNCIGVVNYLDGVPVALTPGLGTHRPQHGVALIAQSGTIIGNMVMNERSLPVSHLFSMGNQSVCEIADAIDVLADDPRVDAILLYIEGLRDGPAFAEAATRAFNQGKTIIALKAGDSEVGRELALSHTGSLAGSPELYEAFFQRLGIITVKTFPELLEMSKMFAFRGVPQGNRLMIETCSGTDSGYSADLAERHGVALPHLEENVRDAVTKVIPAIATAANPLDVTMEQWGDREAQARSLITMLGQSCDAAALVINLPSQGATPSYDPAIEAMIDVKAATDLPCYVITNLPEGAPTWVRELMMEHGVIVLQGLEDAFACIGQAARYVAQRQTLETAGGPDGRLLRCRPLVPDSVLDEKTAKGMLAEAGLPVPSSQVCRDTKSAVTAAQNMGYPAVIKGHGAALAHKSELGAVAVNLVDDAAVESASHTILALDGVEAVLVEAMVQDGVAEIIIGIKRDPTLGLGLILGSGGILTELVRDTITLMLPVTPAAIADALGGLRCHALLTGFRGKPAGDIPALIGAIAGVARFAEDHADTLMELDINPVIVRPEGKGVAAVDALIRLGKEAP
ncbi:MAG: acetate--CoA ligase family protein [Rhodospirillaceae bacterium]|nr:acetate--CoA ligase family protein [Rhodospirillaceae bacterium]